MKKLLFVTLALTMLSCSKDEQDCGCDRVISTDYTLVQTLPQPGVPPSLATIGYCTTRDNCGNEKIWYVEPHGLYEIGDCK
jgi:hypothetical protein